jgi:hypothetical protein
VKVADSYPLKDRGTMLVVLLDEPEPQEGDVLVRVGDGAEWKVRGVERYGAFQRRNAGEYSGLLVTGEPPQIDDRLVPRST